MLTSTFDNVPVSSHSSIPSRLIQAVEVRRTSRTAIRNEESRPQLRHPTTTCSRSEAPENKPARIIRRTYLFDSHYGAYGL